jgi:hypothetical protein
MKKSLITIEIRYGEKDPLGCSPCTYLLEDEYSCGGVIDDNAICGLFSEHFRMRVSYAKNIKDYVRCSSCIAQTKGE